MDPCATLLLFAYTHSVQDLRRIWRRARSKEGHRRDDPSRRSRRDAAPPGLGHLPKKDPASARAWLHGKIFASLLVERMVDAADTFSPWGYRLDGETQPMEGN